MYSVPPCGIVPRQYSSYVARRVARRVARLMSFFGRKDNLSLARSAIALNGTKCNGGFL